MSLRALILSLTVIGGLGVAHAEDVAPPPARAWRFDVGAGLDLRWRREVNPGYGEYQGVGQVFTTAWYRRFGLTTEFERLGARESRTGGLRIRTEGTHLGVWGRYGYAAWGGVTPYASLGGGVTWDTVRTSFHSHFDQRRGSRRFVGLGTGLSAQVWRYVVVEAEARVTSEEAVKFPGLAFVVRAGLTF